VDDQYLRESILSRKAKIVAGYQPIMPTFQGLVTEDQLLQLIEYIKSPPERRANSLHPQAGGPEGGTLKPYDYRSAG